MFKSRKRREIPLSHTQQKLSAEVESADLFATRAWTALRVLAGGLLGLSFAPRLQRWLRVLGVDPFSTGPGIAIIAVFATFGGILTWRATRAWPGRKP